VGKIIQSTTVFQENTLRALCALSDVADTSNVLDFISLIEKAPDPETAVSGVLEKVTNVSHALTHKWRDLVLDVWLAYHPDVPMLPHWSLSESDVATVPIFRDALVFLDAIAQQPAKLSYEHEELLMHHDDVNRLVQILPSQYGRFNEQVESEWAIVELRRLRMMLQAARLIRPFRGELVPVKSRLKRFYALPATQQLYILWHADAYHVEWPQLASLWGNHMRIVQEYLPLLWETMNVVEAGAIEDRAQWAMMIMEAFLPLWEEDGLFRARSGQSRSLHALQQQALPTIIDQFILRDLLERYGLVKIIDDFGSAAKFSWTTIGSKVIDAENSQQLPCGNNLLENIVKNSNGHFNHFPTESLD
jgi:hypothetical protein